MPKSLLFIPDISGYTSFVQSTEIEHSQHVIAELLEILIKANTQQLALAEVEGDALFFYKTSGIPSQEKLLAQIETMHSAFYGHLKLLEKNRICPCNACALAPQLELKTIAHYGDIEFITVQGKKKPFGQSVIEIHRLLKNNIPSNNYTLISKDLALELKMPLDYHSRLFNFNKHQENYDNQQLDFIYSEIDNDLLNILPFNSPKEVSFDHPPKLRKTISVHKSANAMLELITNYKYRHQWIKGVDSFEYDVNEVTRLGTEHVCVIDGKHFNFQTVTKRTDPGVLIYGELTEDIPTADAVYQFYLIKPTSKVQCEITVEIYWVAKSIFKKLAMNLIAKRQFQNNLNYSLMKLKDLAEQA